MIYVSGRFPLRSIRQHGLTRHGVASPSSYRTSNSYRSFFVGFTLTSLWLKLLKTGIIIGLWLSSLDDAVLLSRGEIQGCVEASYLFKQLL